MTMPTDIQEFKKQIKYEIQNLKSKIIGQKSVQILLKTRCSIDALEIILARLDKIEKILQIPSYDLVFIGKIGVGKTTAICHLFNLIREETKPVGKRKIKKVSELLSTGSGRTTICEVVIKPSQSVKSFLEIEPYNDEEVEEFIKEVCTYFWHKEHDQDSNKLNFNLPPAELSRAIKNITALRDSKKEGKLVDAFVELAQTCSDVDSFIKIVLQRAALSSRKQTRLEASHEFKTPDDEHKWLQDNFANLNLGKIDNFSLPKRINIYVNNKIIKFSKYPRFKSIIDTRGIDDAGDRKDLSNYIRGQDDSICLLTEQFKYAPSNVSELLKRYLTQESRDIDTKLALLVLPHKGEPENILGLDGKVEDREEGIETRIGQIQVAFEKDNIKRFIPQNILFYDALQLYDDEHTLKPYYKKSDVIKQRSEILDEINELISRRETTLLEEVDSYKELVEEIKSGGVLSPEEEKLIDDLKKKIDTHIQSNFSSDFRSSYIRKLKSRHVMVFRAINNRYGIYDIRGIDIYSDAEMVSEELLRDKLNESKAEIIGAVEFVEIHASDTSGLKPIMQILKGKVDEDFERIVMKISSDVSNYIKDKFAPQDDSNEFWEYAQNRWGKGDGYREDVLNQYRIQIIDVNNWLSKRVQELWGNFVNQIL